MIIFTNYEVSIYIDGTYEPMCFTKADTLWSKTFFLVTIGLLFALPMAILVILYSKIAINLMTSPIIVPITRNDTASTGQRYRKQVVVMIGTVVLFFFVCLLPFRALVVWIVIVPHEVVSSLGNEAYYFLLYFCRLMFHINSVVNPILYNLMSTKFRSGFLKLCGFKKNCLQSHTRVLLRNSTFTTSTLTANSSMHRCSKNSKLSLKFLPKKKGCLLGHKKKPERRRSFSDFWVYRRRKSALPNRSNSFDTFFRSEFWVGRSTRTNIKFIIKGESVVSWHEKPKVESSHSFKKNFELKESFV